LLAVRLIVLLVMTTIFFAYSQLNHPQREDLAVFVVNVEALAFGTRFKSRRHHGLEEHQHDDRRTTSASGNRRSLLSLDQDHYPIFSSHSALMASRSSASSSSTSKANITTTTKETTSKSKNNIWAAQDAHLVHERYRRDKVPDDLDYIVIGSGIGGLWLAACLSKFGKKCLVLEQHYIAGGFQHSFRRGPYEFVPGMHYIANLPLCAPLYDMVATPTTTPPASSSSSSSVSDSNDSNDDTTTAPSSRSPPPLQYHQAGNSVPADHNATCSHDLKVGDLPVMQVKEGIANVKAELLRVFPDEEYAIVEFLKLVEQAKWQAGQFATFKIFPRWLQFLLSQTLCSRYINFASQTTDEVLSRLTTDGRLKTVLSAFGGDLGESLADGSFVMQAAVLGHVLEGCHYPQAGPMQFVRGLVPTIRKAGGDVLVSARVQEILVAKQQPSFPSSFFWRTSPPPRAVGVKLAGSGDKLYAKHGIVSNAGIRSTLRNLLPPELAVDETGPLHRLYRAVEASSHGISHVFAFVGVNASTSDLKLRSSSFYYIPWNETNKSMNATEIQEFYRDSLLDPSVLDVSAGMVFCTAKDPVYSEATMPGRSTAIVFSEARAEDFQVFVNVSNDGKIKRLRTDAYKEAKKVIETKMMHSLLANFPQLKPHVDVVEIGTPLTLLDYTLRTETLGLRHTPRRMTDLEIRPDCAIPGLYFTGQDISFAGWAGAMTGAMVTAQRLLGYTLLDFAQKHTLMRDLGKGHVEDMIQDRIQQANAATPLTVMQEIFQNAVRHVTKKL
jgi:all-trans-retinol 13,14-reductase